MLPREARAVPQRHYQKEFYFKTNFKLSTLVQAQPTCRRVYRPVCPVCLARGREAVSDVIQSILHLPPLSVTSP